MAKRRHPVPRPAGQPATRPATRPARRWLLVGGAAGVVVVAAVAIALFAGGGDRVGWNEQGRGGSWTNVTAGELASMLDDADLTVVNVKTPYIGEIPGTDLVIPYTELGARATELPANRAARILVYCRAGNESRVAAQMLLDLGYTSVWNLDGGMTAWSASGRSIVQGSGR